MFPDSKSPFAAAPTNGSPNPFQPAPVNGAAPANDAATSSPFGALAPAAAQPSLPAAKPVVESAAASPFSIGDAVKNVKSTASAPFEPGIVEPTEGFTANEKAPSRPGGSVAAVAASVTTPSAMPTPAPVAMPNARPVGSVSNANGSSANRNDPFAAPAPATPAPAGRGDFVLPAESTQAAPAQRATAPVQAGSGQVAAGQTQSVAATPAAAAVATVTGETSQLVLRAIFGVTRELDREEILQRARTLPGIRNLHMVGASEGAAMSSLRESIQRMGFGDKASLALTTSGGVVDIIEEPGTTLAVLHEGTYAAGVRETLIIVARELSRLA